MNPRNKSGITPSSHLCKRISLVSENRTLGENRYDQRLPRQRRSLGDFILPEGENGRKKRSPFNERSKRSQNKHRKEAMKPADFCLSNMEEFPTLCTPTR